MIRIAYATFGKRIVLRAVMGTALILGSNALSLAADRPAKELFGARAVPADLAARSIGSYARGCLAGGMKLEVDGPYWQAMRLSRNRNWGHPELVKFLKQLAEDAATKDGWPGLMVGDLAQPRGGPMLTGHASHQIGLDADIWLRPMPDRRLTRQEREEISAISVLKQGTRTIDDSIWTDAHYRVIRRAALDTRVARIFVHPAIKERLCESAPSSDRAWLRRIRPWYGHHYHFHVRLTCPAGSKGCKNQDPPPAGDGCGKAMAWWLSDEPWRPKPRDPNAKPAPPRYKTLASLPNACRAVLEAAGPGGATVPKLALTWPPHSWNEAPPPRVRPR